MNEQLSVNYFKKADENNILACDNIVLIGLPGSGKTSAGQYVARLFSWPFIDSDAEIEVAVGMSIKDYFSKAGERAFRDKETVVLKELTARQGPYILSTGGGAVLREKNRKLLRAAGFVIYLYATPDMLYRRLKWDTQRPLLQVVNPRAKIQSLFDERDALYRATAHYVVESSKDSLSSQAKMIIDLLKYSVSREQ